MESKSACQIVTKSPAAALVQKKANYGGCDSPRETEKRMARSWGMMLVGALLILSALCAVVATLVTRSGTLTTKGSHVGKGEAGTMARIFASRSGTPVGEFYMINKLVPNARFCMRTDVHGPHLQTGAWHKDNLWYLKKDMYYGHSDYQYLMNLDGDKKWRLVRYSSGMVGMNRDAYYEDQLWKFEKVNGDYYRIYNQKYNCRLSRETDIFKSFFTGIGCDSSSVANSDKQLWRIIPRFQATLQWVLVWQFDNRRGSYDHKETVTVETGLKLTRSETTTITQSWKLSVEASAEYAGASAKTSMEISSTIEHSITIGVEKTTTKTVNTEYIAPTGKIVRVRQLVATFQGQFGDTEGCTLYGQQVKDESVSTLPPLSSLPK